MRLVRDVLGRSVDARDPRVAALALFEAIVLSSQSASAEPWSRASLHECPSCGCSSAPTSGLIGSISVSHRRVSVYAAGLRRSQPTVSWFDALIAEVAICSGCSVLFSEDFSHRRRLAGLEIKNPLLG